MTRTRTGFFALLLLPVVLLVAAACPQGRGGGGSDDDDSSAADDDDSSATDDDDSSAADDDDSSATDDDDDVPEDKDGDGAGVDIDCDDLNAAVRPGAAEACDGWDNDCDGTVAELMAAWPFEDDGTDATGRGRDASLGGGTSWIDGVCGRALALNEGEALVTDGDAGLSSFYTASGLTIALWGRPNDCGVGGGDRFCPYVSKGGSGGGAAEEYRMGTNTARTSTNFVFQSGAGNQGAGVAGEHDVTGDWHYLVGTYDPNGQLNLFRDGVLVVSGPPPSNIPHTGGNITFGSNPAGGLERGMLDVDEARILNCPMDAASVQAHFDCGGCGCGEGVSPCADGEYWTGSDCAVVQ